MKIRLIGASNDFGASKYGARLAPDALRKQNLVTLLNQNDIAVDDIGNVTANGGGESQPKLKNWQSVSDFNKRLHRQVLQCLDNKEFPLVIGGDHSISAGTVSAAAKRYEKLGVIWVDAHGDWNNQQSTPSGNMHGMSYSALCGAGPDCMTKFDNEFVAIDPKRCVLVGARDIDKDELPRMIKHVVTVITAEEVHRFGVEKTAEKALDIAAASGNFYLSFDIDAVSPEHAPGTGTIAPNGLSVEQAFRLSELLGKQCPVGMDMVEVNPTLDVADKTSALAVQIIVQVLKNVRM